MCKHKTEWAYTFDEIKSEIDELKLFDYGINLEKDDTKKQELETKKKEILDKLKPKVENLMFWQEAKDTRYKPVEEPAATTQSQRDFGLETTETPETETKPERIFPNNDTVHHFHPIAWVRQMRLMLGTGIPPWMVIALSEAKKAKYIKETLSPTNEMANKYHTYVGLPKATGSTSWCSSFVCWCLGEAGQKNSKSASSQSILSNEGKLYKRIEEPVFGCIVLLTNYVKTTGKSNSHGHVTFLYGLDANGDLICLGGNQFDRLKFSKYKKEGVNYTFWQDGVEVEQKLNGFFLPINYPISNSKQLDIVDVKKLNNKLANSTVKSDSKNEKTT